MIDCSQTVVKGGVLHKKAHGKATRRHGVRKVVVGLLSMRSPHSIMSFLSVGSILSAGSLLSIGSAGSVLSIVSVGSAGSILGLGSAGYSPGREDQEEES